MAGEMGNSEKFEDWLETEFPRRDHLMAYNFVLGVYSALITLGDSVSVVTDESFIRETIESVENGYLKNAIEALAKSKHEGNLFKARREIEDVFVIGFINHPKKE